MGPAPPKINAAKPGHGLGWSIDWLPDGRLLLTGNELLRVEPDGSMVPHADLAGFADFWNEIVVDGHGNVYVSIAFNFIAGARPNPASSRSSLPTAPPARQRPRAAQRHGHHTG